MDINDITTLTESSESETLEFKETTGTRREAAVTACAFLNQSGGRFTTSGARRTGRTRTRWI